MTSAADLLAILLEILEKFAVDLHGAQTPVRDLWDRQGTSQLYRPIDENGFSDVVARYLRQHLVGEGIFANREVEVVRHPGAPVGTTDGHPDQHAPAHENGEPLDPIAAVIEAKGCWNAELFTALETQLVQDYMVQLRAPAGIYLVGWFDPVKWDPADSRRDRVPRETAENVRRIVEQQAAMAPEGFRVCAVVVEIAAPWESNYLPWELDNSTTWQQNNAAALTVSGMAVEECKATLRRPARAMRLGLIDRHVVHLYVEVRRAVVAIFR